MNNPATTSEWIGRRRLRASVDRTLGVKVPKAVFDEAEAYARRKMAFQNEALVLDLLADFRDAGGVILPVKPNGTVWLIRRRRVVSATVMFVGAGADGLTSFSVLRGRLGTTAWSSEQFTEHDIGKTVFLTKEAAEAALEGGGAWQQQRTLPRMSATNWPEKS